jgi:hypothetical protein
MRLVASTGNLLINTTTDDGFKLDVNGTARVNGSSFFATTSGTLVSGTTTIVNMNYGEVPKTYLTGGTFMNGTVQFPTTLRVIATGGGIQFAQQSAPSPNSNIFFGNDSSGVYYGNYGSLPLKFMTSAVTQMTIFGTGNVGINTTTDAGYKLDVNGTTIVRGVLNVGTISTGLSFSGADCAIFNNGGSGGAISLSMGGNTYLRIYQPINAGSGITVGAVNTITTPITYAWASGTASPNLFQLNPNYNFTGTYSGIVRGFYYNPSLSSMTGVTHYAIHSTSGRVRLEGLPTSPTGLSAGDLYNDGGTIKIV